MISLYHRWCWYGSKSKGRTENTNITKIAIQVWVKQNAWNAGRGPRCITATDPLWVQIWTPKWVQNGITIPCLRSFLGRFWGPDLDPKRSQPLEILLLPAHVLQADLRRTSVSVSVNTCFFSLCVPISFLYRAGIFFLFACVAMCVFMCGFWPRSVLYFWVGRPGGSHEGVGRKKTCFLLGQAGCISVAAWTQLKVAFCCFVFVWWLDCLLLKEGASAFCSLRWLLLVGSSCPSRLLPKFSAQKEHELWSFQSIPLLLIVLLKRDGARICFFFF